MASLADVLRQTLDVRQDDGEEWLCICPFHPDTSPSFRVNVVKGLYICYACGAKGGRSSLMTRLGISARGPRTDPSKIRHRALAMRSEAPRRRSKALPLPETVLTSFRAIETDYWAQRGFSPDVVEKFDLGYDITTNAATIPVRTSSGDLVAIIRRHLDPNPRLKYRYPKGFSISQHLWGAHAVETNHVAIAEGPLDAVALWDAGVPAVALMGCRMSRFQERILKGLDLTTVTLFLDNDRAGREAADRIADRLASSFIVKRVRYPRGVGAKDPGELDLSVRKEMYGKAQSKLDRLRRTG